ncbi:alpha/beta hydrolase-fold protein [Ruminococcus sp.]|uniref:alpha/beta hydrolase-fold protein n=1 Tax=Ruminococcus sp. TaxID=41978 RepID=UPI00388EB452
MKKRLLSILLLTAMLLGVACGAAFSSNAAGKPGDVDDDDDVTIIDVTLIQRHLADVITLDEAAQKRGMVAGDDELTIIDATLIQRYIADVITRFPVEDILPTEAPTEAPTQAPTSAPTQAPTEAPDEVTKVKDNITIYFSNNKSWSKVNAYIYNDKTGAAMKAWPGTTMTNYTTNTYGEKVYSMTVNAAQYNRVIFNNGSAQTTDTPLTKASSGYFINGTNNGKQLAGLYPYGQSGEGTIETVTMDYPDGYKKKIYVWLPEGYNAADKSKKYPVLYMCDGQNLFGQATTLSGYEWECDETALSLMQNGGDGVIIVGVACGDTSARRNHELTPNLGQLSSIVSGDASYRNGGGKVFSDFVVDTVMPYVEGKYNTNSIRGVAGSSSGGIEAFYIGMEHPDKFRYIGALSPAFILYNKDVWDNYLSAKSFTGELPRVYFFCGNSANDQLEQALYPNATAMEGWMKNHGYPAEKMITVTDADATHSEAFWALYFPEMLSWGLEL